MLLAASKIHEVPPKEPVADDPEQTAVGGVDTAVTQRIGRRLQDNPRFERVVSQPSSAPNSVVAEYDLGYFPPAVSAAYLQIRWYETNDFSIHYSEQYDESAWECRWDRHPNSHNTRDHFHPPPDAATPGNDTSYATDWRDVLATVLNTLDDRIQAFWNES